MIRRSKPAEVDQKVFPVGGKGRKGEKSQPRLRKEGVEEP